MIDIHLVSWNRPDMTNLVIRTLKRNTREGSYRLVVFDNGSERSTVNMLIDLQENGLIDELHLEPTNIGLEKARQWMLMNSTMGDYFVCLDNDCLAPYPSPNKKDWLTYLRELMAKYEDFAAISLRTQVMIGTGNIFEEADINGDDIVEFPHPGGSFRIMRTIPTRDVGGWDRGADGRGAEERLVCGKLRDIGYRTAFAVYPSTLHLFGNRAKTSERWGYSEGMAPEETGHSDISHPALTNGDDYEEVSLYAGEHLAKEYFK